MNPKDIAYDVCRCYIDDHSSTLTPLLPKLQGYLRSRNLKGLCESSSLFDSTLYTVDVLVHLKQIEAFFRKNADFSDEEVCVAQARHSFNEAERKCRITNRRLEYFYLKRDRLDPDLQLKCDKMASYVARVLGNYDEFISELPRYIRVTSGASALYSRRLSVPFLKVGRRIEVTPSAVPYISALSKFFGYSPKRMKQQWWNRVELVPKNWKTHRSIACEPSGNLSLQLAFDTYCKRRLRRYGIDLSDQSLNQRLSRRGSIDGSLATIDLSMASDTLAQNAVAWLVPIQWYEYLSNIRSPVYKMDNDVHRYAKFSSMGNGATFCLETLIFAAACFAVGSKQFSVYGDDIIIESELYGEVCELLRFFGFGVNHDKSFSTGSFRESCGEEWYAGRNVTPKYLRKWDIRKSFICHNVNTLASVAMPEGKLWKYLKDVIVNEKLPLVPFTEDSTQGVWIDIWSAYHLKKVIVKNSRHYVKAYVPKARTKRVRDSRTLFLWHLDKLYRDRILDPDGQFAKKALRLPSDRTITSMVAIPSHKYDRKWIGWFPPTQATPVHLFWWTDYITAETVI